MRLEESEVPEMATTHRRPSQREDGPRRDEVPQGERENREAHQPIEARHLRKV